MSSSSLPELSPSPEASDIPTATNYTSALEKAGCPNPSPPTKPKTSQPPIPVTHIPSTLLIGISGSLSSGKTTLAHLLRHILSPTNPVFIIHQDDFFIPKHLLVPSGTGELDADCADAIDVAAFLRLLGYAKREGRLPSTLRTLLAEEYERARALASVDEAVVEDLKTSVGNSGVLQEGRPVGMVEGFLLYQDPAIRELLDIKVFLRTSKEESRARRFERPDYTSSEVGGEFFWRTEEYYDRVVWPNYMREHGFLFEDADVEGKSGRKASEVLRISVQPVVNEDIQASLRWAIDHVVEGLGDMELRKDQDFVLTSRQNSRNEFCGCRNNWHGKVRKLSLGLL